MLDAWHVSQLQKNVFHYSESYYAKEGYDYSKVISKNPNSITALKQKPRQNIMTFAGDGSSIPWRSVMGAHVLGPSLSHGLLSDGDFAALMLLGFGNDNAEDAILHGSFHLFLVHARRETE